MPEDPENLVLVGEIAGVHGVRGEVKLRPLMDRPELLAELPAVHLRLPDSPDALRRVASVRMHHGAALLSFEGVSDRNRAEEIGRAHV